MKKKSGMRRRVSFLKSKLLKQMAIEHNQMLIVHFECDFGKNHSN